MSSQSIPFKIGRLSDNELILFDEERQESWIIYPPRSKYEFVKRPTGDTTVVEHHPWAAFVRPTEHYVRLHKGCLDHGLDCDTKTALQAAVDLGWDPFR